MVSRTFRLQKNRDVRRVQQKGRKLFSKNLRAQVLVNRYNHLRFTVIIGAKSVKKATDRNRAKRQIRALFGQFIKANPKLGLDVCVYVSNFGQNTNIKAECDELFGSIKAFR